MNEAPSSRPGLLDDIRSLAPEEMRERVTQLTNADLETVMHEAERVKEIPDAFRDSKIMESIERRMEELGVQQDVRDRWQALKAGIESRKDSMLKTATDKAEKAFLARLMEKGGVWAMIGSAGLSILSFLGFGKAKKLKESLKEKGYLRTAIEGTKEHPIFAMFVTGLGLKAGTEAYEYIEQNMPVIKEYVEGVAGKSGGTVVDVAHEVLEKTKDAIGHAKDTGVRMLVKGLAFATGGEYDEKTGVVTLTNSFLGGQKSLRPPAIVAWQAGVRADGGAAVMKKAYSLFLIEDRFDAIVRQADTASSRVAEADAYLKLSAKRGQELLQQGIRPGPQTKESRELSQIMNLVIEADPELQKTTPLKVETASAGELEARLKHTETELQKFFAEEEAPRFKQTGDEIKQIAYEAEKSLASADYKGSAESLKTKATNEIRRKAREFDVVNKRKVSIVQSYQACVDALGNNLRQQGKYKLDTVAGGESLLSRSLEGSVRRTEKFGVYMSKVGPGKWVGRAITGYSFLPLALEGAAALQSGEAGAEAKQAFMYDAGEAVGGFIPGVGEALDFRSAIMGTDLNGRELDTWARVTAGTMGTLGTASIVAGFFTGGTTIVGFRALRGALAARKARKVYKAAKLGIETAGVTADAIKAMDRAKDATRALEKMQMITTLQKNARRVQNVVHSAQRTMQLTTYGHLGLQLYSGVTTLVGNAEDIINTGQAQLMQGVENVESFITQKASSST